MNLPADPKELPDDETVKAIISCSDPTLAESRGTEEPLLDLPACADERLTDDVAVEEVNGLPGAVTVHEVTDSGILALRSLVDIRVGHGGDVDRKLDQVLIWVDAPRVVPGALQPDDGLAMKLAIVSILTSRRRPLPSQAHWNGELTLT